MKKFMSMCLWLVKFIFIALCIFLCSLFFRDQIICKSLREKVCDKLSSTNMIVKCDYISFGFKNGIIVKGIRAYDREKEDCLKPVVSIDEMNIHPIKRCVKLLSFKYQRLGDSYYKGNVPQEKSKPLIVSFPKLPDFELILEDPDILGLVPKFVTSHVHVEPTIISIDGIHIDWPMKEHKMKLDGFFRLDIAKQTAIGEVGGHSLPQLIRPLIVALDVPSGLPYMDAFTEITEPVPARGRFDVNLINNDFKMKLDLKPTMGKYNGVSMTKAEGVLDLYVYTRGTNCNVTLNLDLPRATDLEGKMLSGMLEMRLTNELIRLSYDVKSELGFIDALKVADFIDPAALDIIRCDTKPYITIRGVSGVSAKDSAYNNLLFTARLSRGAVFGFDLKDIQTDFSIKGEDINFTRIFANGKNGGTYRGTTFLHIPGYEEDKMTFKAVINCENGALVDWSNILGFNSETTKGIVNGWCQIEGPAQTNSINKIKVKGNLKITEGQLAQIKLFAGLTKIMAEKVPGVSFLVDQTEASADFIMEDGVLKSDNIFLEGGFFSIKSWGEYDIVKDNLNFTLRVQFLKKDSLLGKLLHPITWPFTKLLLEFKLKGSLEKPQWEYISIIDRVL